jgi:DNA repair ATPase RecN
MQEIGVTENRNLSEVRARIAELREAQRHLCEDVYQILRRLDEIENAISKLEKQGS